MHYEIQTKARKSQQTMVKYINRELFLLSFTCPPAAPILPVPSTMPVTVAKASLLPLRASCLPRSADMAELIMLDGPPMKKPVIANSTALINWSLGEPEKDGER